MDRAATSGSGLPGGNAAREETASGLEVRLFGPMEVRIGDQPLPRLRSRKGRWLLALLALRAGRDIDRAWLAGTLWPDASEEDARRSLRQSLHDLRRSLGPEAWRLAGEATRMLRLNLPTAWVDALAFDAAVAAGMGPAGASSLELAVGLYRGPLLEDCFEEWILEERERRRQAYLTTLERLAAAAAARGDHAAAAAFLRLAVGADPYRDELRRALMVALTEGGNPAGALLVYREFRDLLWREMAAEPSHETTSLFQALREETRAQVRTRSNPRSENGETAPPATHGGSPPTVRRLLPLSLTPLVGREEEVQGVAACLAHARLVTLTGAGGIGKTRLALQVAEELLGEYADGAAFVNLAPLTDHERVPSAVRAALGMPPDDTGGVEPVEVLGEYLSRRRLLLVLDNCEHLLKACAFLAQELLSRCAGLRILATSRQPLGLSGETVRRVPSLRVPVAGWTAASAPAALHQYPAAQLFLERAGAAEASFELTPANAPAIAEVCRRLDGIPLAIELAAARVRAMPVELIARRLDDRFRLLTGGSHVALPRQRTLRAMMDWSYDLLSEPERVLLRRLSVFLGGFTLEAAEAVCRDEPPSPAPPPSSGLPPAEVLDLLAALVDRSLVGVARRGETVRYELLETTREYALERLREAEEEHAARARHARYFLAVAEHAAPELKGPAQVEWLQRLEEEHDNCRAATDYYLAQGPVEEGLRLGSALGWFWWIGGYFSEGRKRLLALLARSGYEIGSRDPGAEVEVIRLSEDHPEASRPAVGPAQVRALSAAGMLADDMSDYAAARMLFEESLALSRQLGDLDGIATALNSLGGQVMHTRDYPAARALYEESLAVWHGLGDQWRVGSVLTSLGRVACLSGDHATARSLLESGLAIQRQLQDRRAIARTLTALGINAEHMGDNAAAWAFHTESLAVGRELGAKLSIEDALYGLANLASEMGNHDAALALHEERLELAREMGQEWGIAESLSFLGLRARDRGEEARAALLLSESLAISQKLGDTWLIAQCLEGVASLPALRSHGGRGTCDASEGGDEPKRAVRAARLFGAAATLRESAGMAVPLSLQADHERRVLAVRAMLAPAAFAAAWAEGREMGLEDAIACALQESRDTG